MLRKIRAAQAFMVVFLTAGQGLAADLLVCDCSGDRIVRYVDTLPASSESIAGGSLNCPLELTFGPDGNLYATSFYSGSVLRFDGTSGEFLDEFVSAGSGGLSQPWGLTFGPDGNLYVTSSGNERVLRYDGGTGAFLSIFASVGLVSPSTCLFGPDGNLYVADRATDEIRRFNGASGDPLGVFLDAGTNLETFVYGPDGNIYVTGTSSADVRRYDGNTGASIDVFIPSGRGGLSDPRGIAFGPNENVYVSDANSNKILRYRSDTGIFLGTFVEGIDGYGMVFSPPGAVSQPTILLTLGSTVLSIQAADPLDVAGQLLNGATLSTVHIFAWICRPDGSVVDIRPESFRGVRAIPPYLSLSIQKRLGLAGEGLLTNPGNYVLGTRVIGAATGGLLSQTFNSFEVAQ